MQSGAYSSISSCVVKSLRAEGLKGLYSGASTLLYMAPIRGSLVFSVYRRIYNWCPLEESHWKGAAGGLVAGLVITAFTSPFELVKCRMQVRNKDGSKCYTSIRSCVESIYRSRGIVGLFAGTGMMGLREIPGTGLFFGVYEYLNHKLTQRFGEVPWWGYSFSSSLGGILFWCFMYPVDTVKTLAQISEPPKAPRVIFRVILRNEGVLGFYKGYTSTVVRTCIGCAAGYSAYEYVRSLVISLS